MPAAILMCGIPGSGKSHVRDALLRDLQGEFTVVAPDDIMEEVGTALDRDYRGVYDDDELRRRCYDAAWARVSSAAQEGKNLLIDRTHIDAAHRLKTMDAIRSVASVTYTFGVLSVLTPPASVWVQRLDSRICKAIPAEVLFSFARVYERPHALHEGLRIAWEVQSDDDATIANFASLIEHFS